MPGDQQNAIARHLLTTLQGVTIAAGYDLPEDFKLVTNEVLMWDQCGGLYPSLVLQVHGQRPEPIGFAYDYEGHLAFRAIVYFRVPIVGGPEVMTEIRAADYARRYVVAITEAYTQDISRGSLADWTVPDETPEPLVWRDQGAPTVFEATAAGTVVYEYTLKV